MLIVAGLIFFQQFTGINVIQFYTQSIAEKAGDVLPKGLSAMMVGLTQFLSSIVTPFATHKFGLKIPLLISALGTAVSQVNFKFMKFNNQYLNAAKLMKRFFKLFC